MAKDNAERIAKGLTEAARESLINGHCTVPRRRDPEWSSDCVCSVIGIEGGTELLSAGLIVRRERFPGGFVRTPLGLEVRRILTERTDHVG